MKPVYRHYQIKQKPFSSVYVDTYQCLANTIDNSVISVRLSTKEEIVKYILDIECLNNINYYICLTDKLTQYLEEWT